MWTSDRLAEVEGATKVTVHERKKKKKKSSMVENISHTHNPQKRMTKAQKGPK